MKKTIVALLIFLGCSLATSAQNKARSGSVKELMELMGMQQLMVQMTDMLFEQMRSQLPDVEPAAWNEMKKEISANEIIDLVVPVYEKHFTEAEIRGLIDFYKTPLGQKVIARLPVVMQEAGKIGEEWGQDLAKRMVKRLKEKGFIKE